MIRLFAVAPEDKLTQARGALDKALGAYEAAIDYSSNEAKRHDQEIDALSKVISDKRTRVSELGAIRAKAEETWSAIAGLLGNEPNS